MHLIAAVIGLTEPIQTTMNKIAVDTNIMLYALDSFDLNKQKIAIQLLADQPYFCSQNLSEFINVCQRRWKWPKQNVADVVQTYLEQCSYVAVTENIISSGISIMKKHDFQLFDSIIVAASLDAGCSILYTEDIQHGQVIGDTLKIVNPFI